MDLIHSQIIGKNQRQAAEFKPFTETVVRYTKYVVGIVVCLVLMRIVKAVAMYELVEKFLQEEYEDSYDSWVRAT